jgi:geranylgeranyl pyrophosphate synthase
MGPLTHGRISRDTEASSLPEFDTSNVSTPYLTFLHAPAKGMTTADELNLVERDLEQALHSDVELLRAASARVIRAGGKRLRPTVVLLSYKAVGGQDISQAVPLAAAVELLHTASLVHDDINDHSDLRRGQKTANAQWGDGLALLIGDYIFVRLLQRISGFAPQAIRAFADCCTSIVEGETLQMLHLGNLSLTEELYLQTVTRKTAHLFSTCAELGAFVGGGTEEAILALKKYGLNLGIAFQIRDDTLDWVGKEADLGKPIASDLKQGKVGLATIFALKQSECAENVLLAQDWSYTLTLLQETGALDYAMLKCAEYSAKAQASLANLAESEAKTELLQLAEYAAFRDR